MTERSLDEILRVNLWEDLGKAAKGENMDWKTAWVASLRGDGTPALRMMVLREVDAGRRELVFFTDTRSPKWQQLTGPESAVELGFWSPERKVQLRCHGHAILQTNDPVATTLREQVPPHSIADYTALLPPGTEISSLVEGQATGERWHFGVVRVRVASMDWLRLDRAGHQRAQFCWQNDHWAMSWVQP